MTKNFLLQAPWPPFVHGGKTFDLSHLNERVDYVVDSDKKKRTVLITFTDHCFTRNSEGEEDAAPQFPDCTRTDGRFCTEHYTLSILLNDYINLSSLKNVWNTDKDEHYAIVRGVDHRGSRIEYAIIFSLDKLRGIQAEGGARIELHMRVRTAHKREEGHAVETFGSVRFSHLVKLVMEKKRPPKIYDRDRKRPGLHKKKQALSGLYGSKATSERTS
jgi:hypothetical protein